MMRLDDGARNGEPQTEPTVASLNTPHPLFEGIKNSWQKFRLNPNAVVAYADNDLSGVVDRVDMNRSAFRREFDRILDDIPKNLHQARIVGPVVMFRCGEIGVNAQLLVRDLSFENIKCAPHRRVNVDRANIKVNFSLRDSGEIEDVIDQACFELNVTPNDIYRAFEFAIKVDLLFQQFYAGKH